MLDATQNMDEVFSLDTHTEPFGAVGEYFASAFFVLTPNRTVLDAMQAKLKLEVWPKNV